MSITKYQKIRLWFSLVRSRKEGAVYKEMGKCIWGPSGDLSPDLAEKGLGKKYGGCLAIEYKLM